MAIEIAKTSTESEQKEKTVEWDVFHLDMIPDAMENMGWEIAPKIMRHWFSISPAYSFDEKTRITLVSGDARLIPSERVNDSIIKMSWAMKYKQVNEVVDSLLNSWASENGIALLRRRLKEQASPERGRLGDFSRAIDLDATSQVNLKPIGSLMDTINDWYGAIGTATIKVAVRGVTSVINHKDVFIVDCLGFYIKDTYDFVDEKVLGIDKPEPLGVWSKKGILNKNETAAYLSFYVFGVWAYLVNKYYGFVPVFNSDFRKWQEKNNSGGDFVVFSDVMWVPPLEKNKIIYL